MSSPLNRLLKMDDLLYSCFEKVDGKEKLLEESNIQIEEFANKKIHRPACMKLIWGYIKQNNLQDPSDARVINCDSVLQDLFGVESVSMFKLAGGINKHLL